MNTHNRRRSIQLAVIAGLLMLSGCASTQYPAAIVQAGPEPEIEVHAQAFPRIGNVLPVRVSVENKRNVSRRLSPSRVTAIAASGEEVTGMTVDEAAAASGDADALRNSLPEGRVGPKIAEALIVPPAYGFMAGGQVAGGGGAMLFTAVGLIVGSARATQLALSPNARLGTVMLSGQDLGNGVEAAGYVFYPAREYRALEVGVSNLEAGSEEVVTIPWTQIGAESENR